MTEAGRHGLVTAACLVAAVLLAPGVPWAGEDHDKVRALREAGEIVPLEKVVEIARGHHEGHLLQVELEQRSGGRYVYEVEFVDQEGVVWKMYFDAKDAALIESGREED